MMRTVAVRWQDAGPPTGRITYKTNMNCKTPLKTLSLVPHRATAFPLSVLLLCTPPRLYWFG